ncbi:MAG: isocitrate lyase [Chloroflexi bacterium UTCFX4]|jgi:isocitrate lyase|nr:MAG: isocitrate lyase [Chloroflexi bacterium UTCFX4]
MSYDQVLELENEWKTSPRWKGVTRAFTAAEVVRLRGSVRLRYSLAEMGALRLWELLETEPFVRSLGAMSGNQAVEMVAAGLKAIYVSGWQVAGDANDSLQMYPDQSLYSVSSVPTLIKRINNALQRADQIQHMQGKNETRWFAPLVADAEAGFGGTLNVFELVKAMIEAGTAAVHLEDQVSALKKCGHMGGKVLVGVHEFLPKLNAARLAADVMGVPTLIIARTDAEGANLMHTLIDPIDQAFMTGERTIEGYHVVRGGLELAIAKGRAYAPYADVVWCETNKPDLGEAREFAQGIHEKFPGKWLAYNCSPSFNWKKHLDEKTMLTFQEQLGEMGYKFQFVTLAGFHTLNASMFDLAHNYNLEGMLAYSRLQEKEFEMEYEHGYKAVKHQSFVGAGYFDEVQTALTGEAVSTKALTGSTEEAQFYAPAPEHVIN